MQIVTEERYVQVRNRLHSSIIKCRDENYLKIRIQQLRVRIKLFGITVMDYPEDEEIVPEWALDQVAMLGSTEWKSKFAKYMH